MSFKVRDLMSTAVVSLERHETLDLAGEIMKIARLRHLPVVESGKLVGLVTHRDLLRAQVDALGASDASPGSAKREVAAGDIMTQEVQTISPDADVLEAARQINQHKIGCLPVVENGALVGIVTEADFLELVIDALQKATG